MSAHTPGPWICEAGYGNHGLRIDAEHGVALGHVRAFIPSGEIRSGAEVQMRWEEGFANARLISAAPELLEALEGMLALAEQMNDASDEGGQLLDARVDAAIAVIAKVRGAA